MLLLLLLLLLYLYLLSALLLPAAAAAAAVAGRCRHLSGCCCCCYCLLPAKSFKICQDGQWQGAAGPLGMMLHPLSVSLLLLLLLLLLLQLPSLLLDLLQPLANIPCADALFVAKAGRGGTGLAAR
jgi:hypothetical protein